MTGDDIDRALESAIAATGVDRYRYLCTDHPDPTVRAQYRGLVVAIAAEGRPPLPAVAADYAIASPAVAVDYGALPPDARPCGACP